MSTKTTQFIISAVIFASVFLLFYLLKPNYEFNPTGIILPVGKLEQAIDVSQVNVMPGFLNIKPLIAYINVEYHYHDLSAQAQEKTLLYARQLAAKVGAKALIIDFAGYSSEMSTFEIHASAVKS